MAFGIDFKHARKTAKEILGEKKAHQDKTAKRGGLFRNAADSIADVIATPLDAATGAKQVGAAAGTAVHSAVSNVVGDVASDGAHETAAAAREAVKDADVISNPVPTMQEAMDETVSIIGGMVENLNARFGNGGEEPTAPANPADTSSNTAADPVGSNSDTAASPESDTSESTKRGKHGKGIPAQKLPAPQKQEQIVVEPHEVTVVSVKGQPKKMEGYKRGADSKSGKLTTLLDENGHLAILRTDRLA